MAEIGTLISDIYRLLEQKSFDLNVSISHDVSVGAPTLRMSNLGMPLRQLYYQLTGAPAESLTGETLLKFGYGHLLESLIMDLAERAGHSVKDRQLEVSLDGVPGHIDGSIDDVLVDAKSCSPYAFNKFKEGSIIEEDNFGYITQLSSYWACLDNYKRAAFLAINKVTGELCLYELDESNKRTKEQVQDKIQSISKVLADGKEPDFCYEPVPDGKSGNRRLSVPCTFCSHKFHCHRNSNDGRGLQVYDYSNGIKYLTKVVREPKVELIPFSIKA